MEMQYSKHWIKCPWITLSEISVFLNTIWYTVLDKNTRSSPRHHWLSLRHKANKTTILGLCNFPGHITFLGDEMNDKPLSHDGGRVGFTPFYHKCLLVAPASMPNMAWSNCFSFACLIGKLFRFQQVVNIVNMCLLTDTSGSFVHLLLTLMFLFFLTIQCNTEKCSVLSCLLDATALFYHQRYCISQPSTLLVSHVTCKHVRL